MMKLRFPKRWLNRTFCYVGIFGLVFQGTAAIHAWWNQIPIDYFWPLLLAPVLCLASGLMPLLQLQKEP
ncbi:hypothetical protein [Alishewanella sp. HL-SH06]|uniref:hypothetical protein n=1 Tax=Alishewanella sp. HL-SH06 TaxID=3461144 RepID=UPI004042FA38